MGLEALFRPRGVAVIGVGRSPDSVGHGVWRNLSDGGFEHPVYAVNPSADTIDGQPCYASIAAVPSRCDLAVIAVPAAAVTGVVTQCGEAGVSVAVVISAGFKETGKDGARLERELTHAAREAGVRVVGPNCLGAAVPNSSLNASFARAMPGPGSIGFLSQSGALGTAILDWAISRPLGMGAFVSLGNRADVDESDLFDAWRADEGISVVAAYLESVANGERFLESAARLAAVKPLVILKSGRTEAGARAVSSHTGSLAGADAAYDAAFEQVGAIRVSTIMELYDITESFARQPVPSGRGLAIVTNAGGPAIMATDACEAGGVALSSLCSETVEALGTVLPAAASRYNPVDVLGDAPAQRYADALKIVTGDADVRSLLVILTPQVPTDATGSAQAVVDAAGRSGLTTLASFMGGGSVADASRMLAEGGVPCFPFPERAVRALSAMEAYRVRRTTGRDEPTKVEADREKVAAAIADAKAHRRAFITDDAATAIAAAYGLATLEGQVARSLDDARAVAERIGYPVALKIASPDILHKSDIGGIRLGLTGPGQLAAAWEDVMSRAAARMPGAVIWGALVQKMAAPGREVIVGMSRDPQFGPLLMFGLGGIYVEVLKDVAFTLCPATLAQARSTISRIRAFGLLKGARGQEPADLDAVADAIVRISTIAADFPDIVELDVNPLIVGDRGKGAVACDIRIGIGG